jgi:CheY-like chemotaxis protein
MKTVRVWIVDDNEPDVYLMQLALQRTDIPLNTTVLVNGEEAMRSLHGCRDGTIPCPDLLFLDFHLPQISGEELLGAVRQCASVAPQNVIVFSSMPLPPRAQGIDWSVYHYLQKPPELHSFVNGVADLVRLRFGKNGADLKQE